MKRQRWLWVGGLVVLLAVAAVGGSWYWCEGRLNRSEQSLADGEFGLARIAAREALQVAWGAEQRNRGKWLLAQATLADATIEERVLEDGYRLLDEIEPGSRVYADARVAKAKQMLLTKIQVRAAERVLEEVLQVDPTHSAANQLLFTIYSLTSRADRADPAFWVGFHQLPAEEQPVAFRHWFLSQFTRNAANRAFDVGTGIVPLEREPSDDDIIRRFIVFKDSEPSEAIHYGAMANWWLWRTETQTALEILEIGQERADTVAEEVYLSSLVQALLNQGNFAQVGELLETWPEAERGFNYLRHRGVYLESTDQIEQAVMAYQQCLTVWPGPIDANVRHRLSQCLQRLGRAEEAAAVVAQTEVARLWLEDRWSMVRKAIDYLHDEQAVGVLLDFFTAIGKQEAVAFMTEHRSRMAAARAGAPAGAAFNAQPAIPPKFGAEPSAGAEPAPADGPTRASAGQ